MVTGETLLQANSTIIAGLLIFLTISSITDYSLLTPYPNKYEYTGSGKPKEAADKFDQLLIMSNNHSAAVNKTHILMLFAILVSPFAISSIAIVCGFTNVSKLLITVGFAVVIGFGALTAYFQYQMAQDIFHSIEVKDRELRGIIQELEAPPKNNNTISNINPSGALLRNGS